MNNKKVAIQGEIQACEYLKKKGYKILDCNYSCKIGELDIVAEHKGIIVFVEVKARLTEKFGKPFEAVNYAKQRKIITTAKYYLLVKKLCDRDVRFDVISILRENLQHIERAFDCL